MEKNVKQPFVKGEKVYLRPLVKSDINKRYLSWLNDAEVTTYMDTGIFPTTPKELERFYDRISKSRTSVMFAIVPKRKEIHIGNIALGTINWVHRYASLGIMIGDKRYWSRGYGQDATKLLLQYAFERLNLNKVFLGVSEEHRSAIRAYSKVGFKVEGRMKKILNIKGRYVDQITMGITQKEFLKGKKG